MTDDGMTDNRIALPTAVELGAETRELLDLTARAGREPARTMAVLAHQPDLLAPFLGWAAALALTGVLSNREHEILALRVAWNCGSDFEWGEHVEYARAAAISDEEILAVARDDGQWEESEAALIDAADELCATFAIGEATWANLEAHFDPPALVEILFVVGQYAMLSMVANAAGITLPEGLMPLPPR